MLSQAVAKDSGTCQPNSNSSQNVSNTPESPIMSQVIAALRILSLIVLGAFFAFTGVSHFTNPDFFTAIVPPYLPAPLALVYISGVFEVLGGVGIWIPALRRAAGWGLIALLIAVFPANLHMAMNPDQYSDVPYWGLLLRLPLQAVLIAWVYWAAIAGRTKIAASAANQSTEPDR